MAPAWKELLINTSALRHASPLVAQGPVSPFHAGAMLAGFRPVGHKGSCACQQPRVAAAATGLIFAPVCRPLPSPAVRYSSWNRDIG
uniref:Uncharacterized protein n=1 Tax=Sphaerodactylus townsendi TaxID=933632 RepID=A0ACB8G633_9SAUR